MLGSILGTGESSLHELPFQGREKDAIQRHKETISTQSMCRERLGENENKVMGKRLAEGAALTRMLGKTSL